MKSPLRIVNFLLMSLLLVAHLALLGCQSASGGKRRLASVVIPNQSPEQIMRTTIAVFEADGYRGIAPSPETMVFEKTGTGWNTAAYGGWTDSKPVTVRVRAGVDPQPDGSNRLWCDAYMVGDAGHALFEEEHKLTGVRRGSYQSLLDKVAEQLK